MTQQITDLVNQELVRALKQEQIDLINKSNKLDQEIRLLKDKYDAWVIKLNTLEKDKNAEIALRDQRIQEQDVQIQQIRIQFSELMNELVEIMESSLKDTQVDSEIANILINDTKLRKILGEELFLRLLETWNNKRFTYSCFNAYSKSVFTSSSNPGLYKSPRPAYPYEFNPQAKC